MIEFTLLLTFPLLQPMSNALVMDGGLACETTSQELNIDRFSTSEHSSVLNLMVARSKHKKYKLITDDVKNDVLVACSFGLNIQANFI